MWMFAVLIFFVMLAGLVGAVLWQVDDFFKEVSSPAAEDGIPTVDPSISPEYKADQPVSMLILGRDTRENFGMMNTDVMMIAVAHPGTKKVTMLSIPRDTRVKVAGYGGYEKINSVYAIGENLKKREVQQGKTPSVNGILLAKKTLSEMLGIPIQYYVEVDFDGFQAVIDELDGVEINVDRRLVYDDPTDGTHINLKPGLQKLNGKQALDYVRHRHDNRGERYYSSDYDRNRRQQEVIRAVVDKMMTLDGLTKVFDIMKIGGKHIRTDLPEDKIKGLALDFKGLSSQSVTTLENGAYWGWIGNMGYTFFPKDKMEQIRTTLQSEMGVKPEETGTLSDAAVASGDKAPSARPAAAKPHPEPAKPSNSSKPLAPEKSTEPAQPTENVPANQANPAPAPLEGTTPEQSGETEPAELNSQTPPPDIVPSTDNPSPQPSPSEEPPADMIHSTNP